ncbi:PREDICTED: unconventional myosin-VI-like, partial [Priapulus caudatus]|uniref:Unconventional myosin-VI-like n=1 Tax=Priapulus caudatus TaxID=37621 RepID=A0ABM1F522_PRICU
MNLICTEEALQAELAQERLAEEARQQKLAQERRDHELATRLAQESGGVVEALETPQLQRSERARSVINAAGGKTHELSKWKYAELRDTINTSCDVALLDACREEFHRRLKVYHEWKSKNKKAAATENQRAPQAVIENSQQQEEKKPKLQRLNRNIDKIRPNVNHRFFRLPFLAPADINREPQAEKKGWWYAHFDGQWIARQLELYPDKQPVLLIAGTDDMQMYGL